MTLWVPLALLLCVTGGILGGRKSPFWIGVLALGVLYLTLAFIYYIGPRFTYRKTGLKGARNKYVFEDESFTESRHQVRDEAWAYQGEGTKRVCDYLVAKYEELTKKTEESETESKKDSKKKSRKSKKAAEASESSESIEEAVVEEA